MFDPTLSPTVHTPKGVIGADTLFAKYGDPLIFAGGTHIMRNDIDYPNGHFPQIIDINAIVGLDGFVRTEKTIEIGAINTIARIKELGESYFSDILQKSLNGGAPDTIKRKATIGGAIASNGVHYNLVAPLIHLGSTVEVRFYAGKETILRSLPISSIYDAKDAKMSSIGLITKVIIPYHERDSEAFTYYREVGSPVDDPASSLVFVGTLSSEDAVAVDIDATILFSDIGFFTLSEKNQVFRISSLSSFKEIKILGLSLKEALIEKFSQHKKKLASKRIDLAVRIFEEFLLSVAERLV